MSTQQLLSVVDTARALSVSPHSIRRWTQQGRIKPVKLGTRTLYEPAEIERFVEAAKSRGEKSADE